MINHGQQRIGMPLNIRRQEIVKRVNFEGETICKTEVRKSEQSPAVLAHKSVYKSVVIAIVSVV